MGRGKMTDNEFGYFLIGLGVAMIFLAIVLAVIGEAP